MIYDFNNNNQNNNDDYFDEDEKVSPENKRKMQRLFIILLSIGLVFGIIASVVVVKVLNHFGMTDKTPQFEHIKK